jgi:hypothetical protein
MLRRFSPQRSGTANPIAAGYHAEPGPVQQTKKGLLVGHCFWFALIGLHSKKSKFKSGPGAVTLG